MNVGDLLNFLYGNAWVKFVLGLILANVLTGVASALYARTTFPFRMAALGDWLLSRAIPYLIGASAVKAVAYVSLEGYTAQAGALADLVWAFVVVALLGKIVENLRELGIPIPAVFGDKPKPEATATP